MAIDLGTYNGFFRCPIFDRFFSTNADVATIKDETPKETS